MLLYITASVRIIQYNSKHSTFICIKNFCLRNLYWHRLQPAGGGGCWHISNDHEIWFFLCVVIFLFLPEFFLIWSYSYRIIEARPHQNEQKWSILSTARHLLFATAQHKMRKWNNRVTSPIYCLANDPVQKREAFAQTCQLSTVPHLLFCQLMVCTLCDRRPVAVWALNQ